MTQDRVYFPPQTLIQRTGVQPSTASNQQSNATGATQKNAPNFQQALQQEMESVKFSQHALQRLASRKIELDQTQLQKLQQAVGKAAQKGSRESLVLMQPDLAFVVSVRNRTVITAVDGDSMKENVFTNIDSAVIV